MKKNQKGLDLLPVKFKFVGLLGIVLSIIFLFVCNGQIEKEITTTVTKLILVISFFIIAFSKDKIEDELTFNLRLKSFAIAVYITTIFLCVFYIVNLVFEGKTETYSSLDALIQIFLFYFTYFFIMKEKR